LLEQAPTPAIPTPTRGLLTVGRGVAACRLRMPGEEAAGAGEAAAGMVADEARNDAGTGETVAAMAASLGACACCTLRLEGCTDASRYVAAGAADAEAGAADACGLCLGLLERGSSHCAALVAKLKEAGFEGREFALSITLPVLAVFRQQLLLARLRGGAGLDPERCVEVKDVLRSWLCEVLTGLGLAPAVSEAAPGSTPAIRVGVAGEYNGPGAAALSCVAEPRGQGGGRKRRRVEAQQPQGASAAAVLDALAGRSVESCLAVVGGTSLDEHLQRVPSPGATLAFELGRDGIYLSGRYVKMSRRLPQSPWFINGERKGESSVEELITGPAARLFGASDCKFHAEGREDIDVRMLGGGRPFVIEVQNARLCSPSCAELEAAVNSSSGGDVLVRRVLRCGQSAMAALQRDAENHRKTYVCVCWSSKPLGREDAAKLAEVRDLEILQKTPVRVLHRRAPAVRPRTLHWLEAELVNDHYFRLRLSTQAGMYIKEFVHGDLGRTRPSMRSLLGARVEILQLDVEGLEDEEGQEAAAPAAEAPGAAAA